MSARLPRKTFAAPFVIVAACAPAPYRNPPPPERRPEPVVQDEHRRNEDGSPVVDGRRPEPHPENPPPPREPEPPRPPVVIVSNPPPPRPPVEDPAPMDTHLEWTLTKYNGKCHVMTKFECPKGRPGGPMPTCNPPPPRDYPCPKDGVIADGGSKVIVQDGNSCRIMPEMPNCPKGAMCNPPPPRDVPCPK